MFSHLFHPSCWFYNTFYKVYMVFYSRAKCECIKYTKKAAIFLGCLFIFYVSGNLIYTGQDRVMTRPLLLIYSNIVEIAFRLFPSKCYSILGTSNKVAVTTHEPNIILHLCTEFQQLRSRVIRDNHQKKLLPINEMVRSDIIVSQRIFQLCTIYW